MSSRGRHGKHVARQVAVAVVLTECRLLSTGEYSDFQIRCENQVFKVYRAILIANSDYFHKALKSNMTVSAFLRAPRYILDAQKEAIKGSISFPDERSHIIARLLEFLYTSAYSLDSNPTISG